MEQQDDHLTPLTTADELERVYRTILEPSFPPEELVSLGELVAAVDAGHATAWALTADGDPVAIAVLEQPAPGIELLLYLAARADQRGTGAGGRIMKNLLAGVRKRGAALLLAEVEHPAHHDAHPAHGDPEARLRFYSRYGARIVDVPYFQAPVSPENTPVYGMLLLAFEVDPALDIDGRLSPATGLHNALRAMMVTADATSSPVDALLDAAAAENGVRLLPTTRVTEASVALP